MLEIHARENLNLPWPLRILIKGNRTALDAVLAGGARQQILSAQFDIAVHIEADAGAPALQGEFAAGDLKLQP